VPLRNLRQGMVLAIAYHFVAFESLPSVQFAPKLLKAAPAGFSPYKPVRPAEVAVAVKVARHSRQQQTLFGSEVGGKVHRSSLIASIWSLGTPAREVAQRLAGG
jgi:hypothetical protein